MLPWSFCGIACCVTFGGGWNSRTGGEPCRVVTLPESPRASLEVEPVKVRIRYEP